MKSIHNIHWIKQNKRFPHYRKQKQVTKHINHMQNFRHEGYDPYKPLKESMKISPWVHVILHVLNAIITSLINNI